MEGVEGDGEREGEGERERERERESKREKGVMMKILEYVCTKRG